jgi:hypothetical protein
LAGEDGEALKRCFAALCTCVGGFSVSEFDMQEYKDASTAKSVLSDLKVPLPLMQITDCILSHKIKQKQYFINDILKDETKANV